MSKKEKKERPKKIPKIEEPKNGGHFLQNRSQNFDFCTCPSYNVPKRDAGGKKGKLLCCKGIFDQNKGNLAEIQPKNHQNVQKMHLLQKVPGVNGLRKCVKLHWISEGLGGRVRKSPFCWRGMDI